MVTLDLQLLKNKKTFVEADDTSDSESSEICNQLTSEGTPVNKLNTLYYI